MTIQKKLYFGFAGSAISVVVVGAFSIHSLAVTAGSLHETIDTTLREVMGTGLAAESAVALDAKMDDYVYAVAQKRASDAAAAKIHIVNNFRQLTDVVGGLRDEANGILKISVSQDEIREEKQYIAQIDELDADRARLLQ